MKQLCELPHARYPPNGAAVSKERTRAALQECRQRSGLNLFLWTRCVEAAATWQNNHPNQRDFALSEYNTSV